jgi:hypothetical protein
VIVVVLTVAAIVVWTKVIARDSDINAVVSCSSPTSASPGQPVPSLGTALPYNALDKVAPIPPADVSVRVLNASTQRGIASQVSAQLTDQGFKITSSGNDPVYPKQNMNCRGQIRFGANGEAGARALSIVVPCTQLVRDERQDATVDIALGGNFSAVVPNSQAHEVIQQLAAWAQSHPDQQGGQQAQGNLAPQLSQSLLAAAHTTQC